jgi:hypothetical protein
MRRLSAKQPKADHDCAHYTFLPDPKRRKCNEEIADRQLRRKGRER